LCLLHKTWCWINKTLIYNNVKHIAMLSIDESGLKTTSAQASSLIYINKQYEWEWFILIFWTQSHEWVSKWVSKA